jgi:cell division protein FtsB
MISTMRDGARVGRAPQAERFPLSWGLRYRPFARGPCQNTAGGPSYADTRRHIVPFVSDGAQAEERVIRPTQRPALDSPITLRRIAVVLIAGICGLVAFAVYGQVAQSRNLDAQVTALTDQNSSLAQQISDRQREIADAQTVAWLEQEARQLGYIFPGEHLYIVVPPGRGTPASGGVSVPVPVFKVPALATPTPTPSAKPTPTPTPTPKPLTVPTPTPH